MINSFAGRGSTMIGASGAFERRGAVAVSAAAASAGGTFILNLPSPLPPVCPEPESPAQRAAAYFRVRRWF